VSQYSSKFLNPIKYINLKVSIHEREFKEKDKKIIKNEKKMKTNSLLKKTNKKSLREKKMMWDLYLVILMLSYDFVIFSALFGDINVVYIKKVSLLY